MLAALASSCLFLAPLQTAAPLEEQPGEVIVQVSSAEGRLELERFLASADAAVLEVVPALGLLLVALPAGRLAVEAAAELSALPGVGFAEPNGWGEGGGFVLDDTYFDAQWPLENKGQMGGLPGADIEAHPAWDFSRGSPGVVVAVLDSGIAWNLHPEFLGRLLPGHDFVNEDPIPADDHGHGTFVTAILAANAGNAFGIAGVDHSCAILPVKVLNQNNRGTLFDLVQGLVFAADAAARVVNMSLINYPGSPSLTDALVYAREAGCVLVACAGNGGIGDADQSLPGRSPWTISVGATTSLDVRAVFSGTGSRLDLVAPGDLVPTTARSLDDVLVLFSGCSAATPIASGIAAMALAIDPALGHEEIFELLAAGAEDQVGPPATDLPGRDDFYGHGRVNLFRTLCALDLGGPAILAPELVRVECPRPGGLPGDDPALAAALSAVTALDDLDPAPALESAPPALLLLGKTVAVPFTARDACGNESSRTVDVRVEDTQAPLVTAELLVRQLDPGSGALVPVELQVHVHDACDPAPAFDVRVFSDEPAQRGDRDAWIEPHRDLLLRAERDAAGDGRVYLVVARARDASGNAGAGCTSAVVPHGPDPAALADVLAQAAAAEAHFRATGTPPPGFSVLFSSALPPLGRRAAGPRAP